jgi:uncharacterized protein (TIGR00297 family)
MVISQRVQTFIHIGLGFAALLLPVLTWWQHVSLAGLSVVACALLLPGLPGYPLVRGSDPRLPTSALCYALGVLLLLVTFPTRPDLAGCAWGILAGGDGAASLAGRAGVGRGWGRVRLPWNRDKSVIGSLAFIVAGSAMGFLLAWLLHPYAAGAVPSLNFLLGATLAAAIVSAGVETIPIRLDDNVSVPAAAALMLWCLALISPHADVDAWPVVTRAIPIGLLINVPLAAAIWWARGVSLPGAVIGGTLGTLIYAGAGWRGWIMLLLAFGAAWVTSHVGLARKRVLGINEGRGGRRGAASALANCGLAALAALGVIFTPFHDAALLALVTALTAGASDTVASEIGKAWGGRTLLITNLRSVAPGTPGAVSLEGTGAGLAWAFLMSVTAGALGLLPFSALWSVVLAATVGSIVESALAATLEADHILNSHVLNFTNTFVAVIVALALQRGL